MLRIIKFFISQSWLLIVACLFFGTLLAVTNIAWRPRIEDNKIKEFQKQVQAVVPDSQIGKPVGKYKINDRVSTELYPVNDDSGNLIAYAFKAEGPAYDYLELVIVVDARFESYLGYGVLVCNETPGFGTRIYNEYFKDQFRNIPAVTLKMVMTGQPAAKDEHIVAMSGATITSQGVVEIFNEYLLRLKKQLRDEGLI